LSKLPWHNNALGFFFWWGRSLKIHIEIKRELFPSYSWDLPKHNFLSLLTRWSAISCSMLMRWGFVLLHHFAKQGIVSFVGLAYPGKDCV
jgi:hypothetical protein